MAHRKSFTSHKGVPRGLISAKRDIGKRVASLEYILFLDIGKPLREGDAAERRALGKGIKAYRKCTYGKNDRCERGASFEGSSADFDKFGWQIYLFQGSASLKKRFVEKLHIRGKLDRFKREAGRESRELDKEAGVRHCEVGEVKAE